MAWKNNNNPHVTPQTRKRILARDRYQCQSCGIVNVPMEADHINNTRGPEYNLDTNLQTLCKTCHRIKTQKEAHTARLTKYKKARMQHEPHPGLKHPPP